MWLLDSFFWQQCSDSYQLVGDESDSFVVGLHDRFSECWLPKVCLWTEAQWGENFKRDSQGCVQCRQVHQWLWDLSLAGPNQDDKLWQGAYPSLLSSGNLILCGSGARSGHWLNFFCFFYKIIDLPKGQINYPSEEWTLFSFVPPSNSLVSVLDPWWAFWADTAPLPRVRTKGYVIKAET